jgi:hypothetical protein
MAVKTGVAKQALGFVEEKLRRVFKLAGPIDASLDPEVKPVIIVDDLRGPGHAFYQGRSWSVVLESITLAAGTKVAGIVFSDDCLVEGFDLRHAALAAGKVIRVFILTPAEQASTGAGITVSTRNATWRDNKTVGALASYDSPPIVSSGGWAATGGGTPAANGNIVWETVGGAGTTGPVPMQLFMPSGSGLYCQELDQVDISMTVWGRIFPQ